MVRVLIVAGASSGSCVPDTAVLAGEIKQVAVHVNVASWLANMTETTINGVPNSLQPGLMRNVAEQAADRLSTTIDNVSETLDSAEMLAQDVREGRV